MSLARPLTKQRKHSRKDMSAAEKTPPPGQTLDLSLLCASSGHRGDKENESNSECEGSVVDLSKNTDDTNGADLSFVDQDKKGPAPKLKPCTPSVSSLVRNKEFDTVSPLEWFCKCVADD